MGPNVFWLCQRGGGGGLRTFLPSFAPSKEATEILGRPHVKAGVQNAQFSALTIEKLKDQNQAISYVTTSTDEKQLAKHVGYWVLGGGGGGAGELACTARSAGGLFLLSSGSTGTRVHTPQGPYATGHEINAAFNRSME